MPDLSPKIRLNAELFSRGGERHGLAEYRKKVAGMFTQAAEAAERNDVEKRIKVANMPNDVWIGKRLTAFCARDGTSGYRMFAICDVWDTNARGMIGWLKDAIAWVETDPKRKTK